MISDATARETFSHAELLAIRDGPAGRTMDEAVNYLLSRELYATGIPGRCPRYSTQLARAWTAFYYWFDSIRGDWSISLNRGFAPSITYSIDVTVRPRGGEVWSAEGEGETIPLAICRLILHVAGGG